VYPCGIVTLMSSKDAGVRVRVEKDLREAFVEACRAQGLAASSVLRDFMHAYAERHQNGPRFNPFLESKRRKETAHTQLINRLAKDEKDAELCANCGQQADNGEGYNGLCGSCADRLENARERGREQSD